MHVPSHPLKSSRRSRLFAAWIASTLAPLLVSCASPGPPKPPSLHLPEVVTDLTAQRIGQEVHLHWTSSSHTTDGLDVSLPMTAEICREAHPQPEPAGSANKKIKAPRAVPGCDVVLQLTVKSGVTEADDRLPPPLTSDPVSLLGYRISLLNSRGHSAGFSRVALVLAGAAPPPISGLRAAATRNGSQIEWQSLDSPSLIELDRTLASPPVKTSSKKTEVSLPDEQPIEVKLRTAKEDEAQPKDPGGTLDRTALRGQTYIYRAQRIRIVQIGQDKLELRGDLSAPLTLAMTDRFPPAAPTGLAAIPGFQADKATIDLSWQADAEADVAGYNVYRREASSGGFARITSKPALGPAFSDQDAIADHTYTYRVTAVDSAGNESPPSGEVTETIRKP